MKKLYYIARIDPRPHLDSSQDVEGGILLSYDEALEFYEIALFEHTTVEERRATAERRRDAAERVVNDDTGCGVAPEYLTDKEYFQRRLAGLQTLEEFRKKL